MKILLTLLCVVSATAFFSCKKESPRAYKGDYACDCTNYAYNYSSTYIVEAYREVIQVDIVKGHFKFNFSKNFSGYTFPKEELSTNGIYHSANLSGFGLDFRNDSIRIYDGGGTPYVGSGTTCIGYKLN